MYDNPLYFTGTFPTLFPYGVGGYLEPRRSAMSIEKWAKVLVRHYNRAFATHHAFTGLVFDVICRARASISRRFLVRQSNWALTEKALQSLSKADLLECRAQIENGDWPEKGPVYALLRSLKTVGNTVPWSHSIRSSMRVDLKGWWSRW